jgi:hypothetical protein
MEEADRTKEGWELKRAATQKDAEDGVKRRLVEPCSSVRERERERRTGSETKQTAIDCSANTAILSRRLWTTAIDGLENKANNPIDRVNPKQRETPSETIVFNRYHATGRLLTVVRPNRRKSIEIRN